MAMLFFSNDIVIPCIFKLITGFYCPGCGITRAILSILEGDVYQAFRYNSIIFIDVPVIVVLLICNKLYKENKEVKKVENIIIYILLVITILYGVLRNIPYFSFLAPIDI